LRAVAVLEETFDNINNQTPLVLGDSTTHYFRMVEEETQITENLKWKEIIRNERLTPTRNSIKKFSRQEVPFGLEKIDEKLHLAEQSHRQQDKISQTDIDYESSFNIHPPLCAVFSTTIQQTVLMRYQQPEQLKKITFFHLFNCSFLPLLFST